MQNIIRVEYHEEENQMFNLRFEAEESSILMAGATQALQRLNENVEAETSSISTDKESEALAAVCFYKRLPGYLSTYNMIARDMQNHIDKLEKAIKEHYEMAKRL